MSRNRSLDLLKLILAAFVVAIHTHFLRDFNIWAYRFTAEGFFRTAVPVFLLINGYFFFTTLQERRLAAWFRHVLSLYAIWMLIYLPLWAFPAGEPLHFSALLRTLVVGWHHLWYLAAMISGGALLALLAHRLSTRLLLMVACTLFVVGVLIQYAGNYHWFAYSAGLDKWTNVVWVYRNGVFTALPMMVSAI